MFSPLRLSHAYHLSRQYDAGLATQHACSQQAYQLGKYLWKYFPPTINQHTMLISIPMHNKQIKTIAWETLYHPQYEFLALQAGYALVRTTAKFSPYKQALYAKPLRILLFTVANNEKNSEPLAIAEEQYRVRELCYQWQQQGYAVELYSPPYGSIDYFSQCLNKHRWDLVILSTHTVLTHAGTLLLCFENQQYLSPQQLAVLCQRADVRHLVLAACASGSCTSKDNFVDALLDVGISQLIVMRERIFDRTAHIFIHHLLNNLLAGHSFAHSVQAGRIALLKLLKKGERWQKNIDHETVKQQWSLPVLYSRSPLHFFKVLKKNYPIFPKPILGFGQRAFISTILNSFQQGNKTINIIGRAGIGKSHCAKMILYHCYEMGIQPISATESAVSQCKKENTYILYFDNVSPINVPVLLAHLCKMQQSNLYILASSQAPLAGMLTQRLTGLSEADFLHYAAYLGLNYTLVQLRFIYRATAGHPQSLALLANIPSPKNHQQLKNCIAYIQRYLAAL